MEEDRARLARGRSALRWRLPRWSLDVIMRTELVNAFGAPLKGPLDLQDQSVCVQVLAQKRNRVINQR